MSSPRNKKDSKEIELKPITPKLRPFKQRDFAFKTKSFVFKSPSFFEKNVLKETGICFGLVTTWCEYITTGKDLLAELNKKSSLSENSELTRNIGLTQLQKSKVSRTFDILENKSQTEKKYPDELTLNVRMYPDQAILANLGFSDAVTLVNQTIKQLEEHLEKLNKTDRAQQGVHTIGVHNIAVSRSHLIGWAYSNKQFFLFDPNYGEYCFDDFKSFKDYLCKKHLPDMFKKLREKLSTSKKKDDENILEISDFYLSPKLEEKQENKP